MIKEIQRGTASLKVTVRCLVAVKIEGNKPIKLLNKINKKREITRILAPNLVGPIRRDISRFNPIKTLLTKT